MKPSMFFLLLRVQLHPKLDEDACDCLLIILFHDLYNETACQERLAKYYYAISALALHPLFVSHMSDMLIWRKTLHALVRFVLNEALGLFLTCSLEFSLSTMLSFKCAVDFSSNDLSKIRRITVQLSTKSARRNLAV